MGITNEIKRYLHLAVRRIHPRRQSMDTVWAWIDDNEIDYFYGIKGSPSVVTIPGADKLPKDTPISFLYPYSDDEANHFADSMREKENKLFLDFLVVMPKEPVGLPNREDE